MADESLDDAWAEALKEQGDQEADTGGEGGNIDSSLNAGTQVPDFAELAEGPIGAPESNNLDFLLDIPLEVTVELGKTSMIINKMLQLTQGSVIELDKAAGEPLDIYVNKKLLGKGEVVVVNERFGIRVTEIISQADRIKNMG